MKSDFPVPLLVLVVVVLAAAAVAAPLQNRSLLGSAPIGGGRGGSVRRNVTEFHHIPIHEVNSTKNTQIHD